MAEIGFSFIPHHVLFLNVPVTRNQFCSKHDVRTHMECDRNRQISLTHTHTLPLTSPSPVPVGWWSHHSCSWSRCVCVSHCPARARCAGDTSQPIEAVPACAGTCPCVSPVDGPAETHTQHRILWDCYSERLLLFSQLLHLSLVDLRILTVKLRNC